MRNDHGMRRNKPRSLNLTDLSSVITKGKHGDYHIVGIGSATDRQLVFCFYNRARTARITMKENRYGYRIRNEWMGNVRVCHLQREFINRVLAKSGAVPLSSEDFARAPTLSFQTRRKVRRTSSADSTTSSAMSRFMYRGVLVLRNVPPPVIRRWDSTTTAFVSVFTS